MDLGIVVFFAVDLFEYWKSWLLWCSTSVRGLQVGPQAVCAQAFSADLFVPQVGKSGSLL